MIFEISIEGAKFYGFHGVDCQETRVGNNFLVDVSVSIPVSHQIDDDITKTVSYADIFEIVKTEMAIPSKLLETVAKRIGEKISVLIPDMKSGYVKITKLSPPIEGCSGAASVKLIF